jgi:hypothetical protein
MNGRRWTWVAVLMGAGIAALLWRLMPADAPTADPGQVRIAEPAPAPVSSPGPAPLPARPIPVAKTRETVREAMDQAYLVGRESRDGAWAKRSEAALRGLVAGIPYIGGHRFLAVKCAATVCEVTGAIDPGADPVTVARTWEALERATTGESLSKDGLERSSAVFGTGRNPEDFMIYYRRIVPAPAG